MELNEIISDVTEALLEVDKSSVPFKNFQSGVGPYGEPQLVRLIGAKLNLLERFSNKVQTKRTPDLLILGEWALEFKITRPFGDNGKEAENWSVNLLHPYPGNVSTIGDCVKLLNWRGPERRAVVVVGYEHVPAQIDLSPLLKSFEIIATNVLGIRLSPSVQIRRGGLVHPIHQALRVVAWEVLGRHASSPAI